MAKSIMRSWVYEWDRAALTRQGIYISEIECRAIWSAQSSFTKPETALEIGCGTGRWSKLLAEVGWRVICTDTSASRLQVAQQRIPAAECILVKPQDSTVPVGDSTIGLMLCIEVPRLPHAEWFINDARRALHPGGMLVATFLNLVSYRGLLAHYTSRLRGEPDHYARSYPHWRKKLQQAGFSIQHEEGLCWFPFGRKSESSLVPLAAKLERYLGLHRHACVSPWIVLIARRT